MILFFFLVIQGLLCHFSLLLILIQSWLFVVAIIFFFFFALSPEFYNNFSVILCYGQQKQWLHINDMHNAYPDVHSYEWWWLYGHAVSTFKNMQLTNTHTHTRTHCIFCSFWIIRVVHRGKKPKSPKNMIENNIRRTDKIKSWSCYCIAQIFITSDLCFNDCLLFQQQHFLLTSESMRAACNRFFLSFFCLFVIKMHLMMMLLNDFELEIYFKIIDHISETDLWFKKLSA